MEKLSGKTALVTGSTDGVGRLVARKLGQAGARVLVHGRDAERGARVVADIKANGSSADFLAADLSALAEVRRLADAAQATVDRLDILINNAGIGTAGPHQTSAEGFELRFAVNYLAGFLLTLLLLPLIKNSAPARIVNVYCQSKLAQIMFTIDLGALLEGTGVTVTCLHPATYMDTSMVRRAGVRPLSTVEEGARAILNLATSPAVEGQTGLYFNGLREAKAQAQAYDPDARRQLKALSLELTGLSAEGVAALER